MLTIACAIVAIILGGVLTLSGYIVGRARKLRDGEGYLAGRADGYQKGIRHGENARAALHRQIEELTADRDRVDAALDELGAQYDRKLAEGFAPVVRSAVAKVYDHQREGL